MEAAAAGKTLNDTGSPHQGFGSQPLTQHFITVEEGKKGVS